MKQPAVDATRGWATDVVRSGLLNSEAALAEIRDVIAVDHPGLDAPSLATEWIAAARAQWAADAATWSDITDHDRLTAAFADLEARGIVVLQGVDVHWEAKALLESATVRGVAWFTAADVWHAIDAGMLEVNLWHGTSANVASGDALLDEAIACFDAAGLRAHFDEGRIEVAAHWQRRPSG